MYKHIYSWDLQENVEVVSLFGLCKLEVCFVYLHFNNIECWKKLFVVSSKVLIITVVYGCSIYLLLVHLIMPSVAQITLHQMV